MRLIVLVLKLKKVEEIERIKELLRMVEGFQNERDDNKSLVFVFSEGEIELIIDIAKHGMLVSANNGIESIPKFKSVFEAIKGGACA